MLFINNSYLLDNLLSSAVRQYGWLSYRQLAFLLLDAIVCDFDSDIRRRQTALAYNVSKSKN